MIARSVQVTSKPSTLVCGLKRTIWLALTDPQEFPLKHLIKNEEQTSYSPVQKRSQWPFYTVKWSFSKGYGGG